MGLNADHILDFIRNPVWARTWQINLVDDREYIQVMI